MHTKTVAKYIRRSPYQAIAAIMIMSLTFLTISVFSIVTIISIRVIEYFESRPQISVFFEADTPDETINNVKSKLESTGKTSEVIFISQEEALSIYREFEKDEPLVLELVNADILPPSLDVKANNINDLPELAAVAQDSEGVESVMFQKDIVDTLTQWTNTFRYVGIFVVTFLVVVSIFVVLTIIGIKITIRKGEIEIMKLIGASDWFIRTPFILEGIFYSVSGAIIGWLIVFTLFIFVGQNVLKGILEGVPVFTIEPIYLIGVLIAQVILAIILGFFASFMAVLRYLK